MPSITIRIDDATSEQVDALADSMDRSRSWITKAALKRYLQDERRWLEHIQSGRDAIERGEGIPHEDVMARMRAKIADHESRDGR